MTYWLHSAEKLIKHSRILYYDWLVHLGTKMIQKQELLTVFSTLNSILTGTLTPIVSGHLMPSRER